jgi:hypothetical protein
VGGFFLITTGGATRTAELAELYQAFAQLGFESPLTIETPDCIFVAYPTIETKALALDRSPNGDFSFVCGSCFDDTRIGCAAASLLTARRNQAVDPCDLISGHYAAVWHVGGRTEITLDKFGGYHLFYNRPAGIVSSSFFALCSVLPRLTLSQQSACEYVFNGVVSGNETLFDEVAVAPIGAVITIGARGLDIDRPTPTPPASFTSATRAQSFDRTMALLDHYFAAVGRFFGDRVNCALSGGYDSRLILAFLRRHRICANLYVYGSAADRDVAIAKEIAQCEGLALAAIDKSKAPVIPPDVFAQTAHRNFLAQDGYSWGGIFSNGAEIAESARRVRGGAIALNGGGGEIFRNFFYLPDREYQVRDLLWSFYSQFAPSVCTRVFDPASYYQRLARKVGDVLGSDERRLPRPTVEWLYHRFRCRSWDGRVESIAARYGFTGMPFLEPRITDHASVLPLDWKNHGDYEAELIRRADPRLAPYRSAYGHNFAAPAPLRKRLGDCATYLRPTWLRRYSYRVKHRSRPDGDWSGYLAKDYRDAVLPEGAPQTSRLFRAERVGDPDQFARILSLEYALRHFGSRVKLDF